MKAFNIFLTGLAILFSAVQAEKIYIPKCTIECTKLAISQLCSLTDVKCMDTCTNPELEAKIAPCVEQKCTVRESLTTQRISDLKCGRPIRDRTKVVSIAGVVGGGVAFLAFILRMMARLPFFNGGPFGMDDVMIIVAMIFAIPFTVFSVFIANAGLGKDIWHVDFDDITKVLYIYYWDEWIYFSAIVPTKMSLHFFYLRIFPKKSFRIAIYIVMGITLAYGIVFILVSVFQCSPIKTAWLRWDGTAPGHCNNINLQGWTSAAINIVLDFVTLALPLRELSQMDLWRKKKIHICIMFSVGSFVTIVSILRLQSLLKFAKSRNFTWDYVEMGYWSTIEVHVGIICACMPAIRSLLRRLFPSFFSYTQHQKSGTFGNSSSHDESVMRNSQPPKSDFHESDSLPLVDVYNSRPQYSYFHAK
ncbi:CFEM domain-containing protein [Histoplasma capsulatum G186AR]|uniref:CFEM domain-containing protein n=1 Tax=Ajellomyces capsulatus TaxID=5037 RepID=A0A8H7YGL1_AJECA|nr:CFEM domain-containing protein [Histoplasma capsulatum]QSS72798.1 CFEM domain-containing protein [Histoplasma capsulatum G186AR]